MSRKMTLPINSDERKNIPLFSGCLKYFPAALAGVAQVSKLGNDKHNPGQPLFHNRNKSGDHGDCILRHLTDTIELLSSNSKPEDILNEVNQMAWRALAFSQELHEKFGAPLAPGAKFEKEPTRLELQLEIERLQKDPEVQKMMEEIKKNDKVFVSGAGHE